MKPLGEVIRRFECSCHQYGGDAKLSLFFHPSAVDAIPSCDSPGMDGGQQAEIECGQDGGPLDEGS